jgi:hypothetical protein
MDSVTADVVCSSTTDRTSLLEVFLINLLLGFPDEDDFSWGSCLDCWIDGFFAIKPPPREKWYALKKWASVKFQKERQVLFREF